MNVSYEALLKEAIEARKNAYTPYSKFKVGAALLTVDGDIIRGCNIENAAYGPTNCAERTAFFKAISEGINEFSAIAIVGGKETEVNEFSDYAYPCGVCRQVMREFCNNDFEIIVGKSVSEYKVFKLSDLLPQGFGPENLL
ncbi:MAG: cytidine deaminase [Lachnospiraceae bacterium]|nr:cytidine deaminase [Lachnospiraceae bacterium]